MRFETGTIPQTLSRLREDGIYISENALRVWIKSGQIPANYCGKRAYIWYPHVISFLQRGTVPMSEPACTVTNGIRRIS